MPGEAWKREPVVSGPQRTQHSGRRGAAVAASLQSRPQKQQQPLRFQGPRGLQQQERRQRRTRQAGCGRTKPEAPPVHFLPDRLPAPFFGGALPRRRNRSSFTFALRDRRGQREVSRGLSPRARAAAPRVPPARGVPLRCLHTPAAATAGSHFSALMSSIKGSALTMSWGYHSTTVAPSSLRRSSLRPDRSPLPARRAVWCERAASGSPGLLPHTQRQRGAPPPHLYACRRCGTVSPPGSRWPPPAPLRGRLRLQRSCAGLAGRGRRGCMWAPLPRAQRSAG